MCVNNENKNVVGTCELNFNCSSEMCPEVAGGGFSGIGTQYSNPNMVVGGLIYNNSREMDLLLEISQKVTEEMARLRLTSVHPADTTVAPKPVDVVNRIRRNLYSLTGYTPIPKVAEGDKVTVETLTNLVSSLNASARLCVCDTRCPCNARAVSNCESRCYCDCNCVTYCYCNTDSHCNCDLRYVSCSCRTHVRSLYACACNSQLKGINNDGVVYRVVSCDANWDANVCEGETSPATPTGSQTLCASRISVGCSCNMNCPCNTRCTCDARTFVP